ncbi:MAG: hypothetical protein DWQ05_13425 [Calditrichaeota bacterium]|nr:MAG: hypothetical protein DWQ05_13425 [Calditrichota bacterium]
MSRKLCFFIIAFILITQAVYANLPAPKTGPPFIPTTGTFRVLAVFVQFQDDTWDHPCPSDPTSGWPALKHAIPEWARGNKLLSQKKSRKYSEGSLSHYFQVMSDGKFDFIGDVFPKLYLTPEPFAFYSKKTKTGRGYLTSKIIDWMDENGVDFSKYDNDNDGDVDYILFLYRHWKAETFTPGIRYQGVSGFGFQKPIIKDGKKIHGRFPASGSMQRGNYTLATCRSIVTHEISHYFFGAGHYSSIGSFGIHDGNAFCYAMSGFEREKLGWITPREISADKTISLTDAITTNQYYKIKVRNRSEYFLLENRQKISIFEKGDCVEGELPAQGLLIARIQPNVFKSRQISWLAADKTFSASDQGEASDFYQAGESTLLQPTRAYVGQPANGDMQNISIRIIRKKGHRLIVNVDYSAQKLNR